MTTTLFFKKQPYADGRCKLYIRVNKGKRRTYIPTDIKLLPKDWDDKKKAVRPSHPFATVLNIEIKKKLLETETEYAIGERVTETKFSDYCSMLIKRWKKLKAVETLEQYETEINKLEEFRKDVLLSEITPPFLIEYQTYLLERLNNSTNTVWKTMKSVKTVIRIALIEKLIKEDPFKIYKLPKLRNGKRLHLTDHELTVFEKHLLEDKRQVVQVVGWNFLLGCYSGLRFNDLMRFNKKFIVNGRVQLYTDKGNQEPVSIKIGNNLQRVINKVLPLPKLPTNNHANDYLKSICIAAGIEKNITFHCARHTFAIRCAAAQISTEVTARLLGHTSLKTTAIYYKIVDKRVDDEMDKLG